jgi:hypothetical protein
MTDARSWQPSLRSKLLPRVCAVSGTDHEPPGDLSVAQPTDDEQRRCPPRPSWPAAPAAMPSVARSRRSGTTNRLIDRHPTQPRRRRITIQPPSRVSRLEVKLADLAAPASLGWAVAVIEQATDDPRQARVGPSYGTSAHARSRAPWQLRQCAASCIGPLNSSAPGVCGPPVVGRPHWRTAVGRRCWPNACDCRRHDRPRGWGGPAAVRPDLRPLAPEARGRRGVDAGHRRHVPAST